MRRRLKRFEIALSIQHGQITRRQQVADNAWCSSEFVCRRVNFLCKRWYGQEYGVRSTHQSRGVACSARGRAVMVPRRHE